MDGSRSAREMVATLLGRPDEILLEFGAGGELLVARMRVVLAALLLLLRNRWAVTLFGASVAAILVTAVYDIAQGTALLLQDRGWLVLECVTVGVALLQLAYAHAMRKRGVLH